MQEERKPNGHPLKETAPNYVTVFDPMTGGAPPATHREIPEDKGYLTRSKEREGVAKEMGGEHAA